jgi:head-tail adaptor
MALLKRLNDGFIYTNRGAMRDQVTIMQPSSTSNPDGSPQPFTVFMQNVWASCHIAKTPTEVNSSELVQGQVFWDVRTPYISGVNDSMQLVGPNGQQWLVLTVDDPDQRQVELRFLCREINGGGVVTVVDETVSGGTF